MGTNDSFSFWATVEYKYSEQGWFMARNEIEVDLE